MSCVVEETSATFARQTVSRFSTRHLLRLTLGLAVVGAAVVGWHSFAPTQLGGTASYVVVRGTSMLPTYKADDFISVRSQSQYEVGDVVAVHNDLGYSVMHRIIAIDGATFTTKGDNNPAADEFQPAQSDIVGKLWLHVPHGGRYMQFARTPAVAGMAFAWMGLWIGMSFIKSDGPESTRRRRHRHTRR